MKRNISVNPVSGVAFFDTKEYDRRFFDEVNASSNYGYNIHYFADRLTPEYAHLAAGSNVVCAFVNDDISAITLEILAEKGVKLLAMRCAGYNNVDLACAAKYLKIVRVPAYSPHAVAEYAVAMLLTLNRKTHRAYFRVRDNNFSINGLLGFDLYGKTVGVVGAGLIGGIFAELMLGFGCRVLVFDPMGANKKLTAKGAEFVDMAQLYAESDIISLHCPLTMDNYHMINNEAILAMKPGVFILNTSRGGLIDSQALINGLKSQQVSGAALDVYEEETDYFFEDYSDRIVTDDYLARLASFNNVLITSHQGFFTREAMQSIAQVTLENIREFEYGETLTNQVKFTEKKS